MFMDERCYEIAKEKHYCPHCEEKLSCCHTPPYHVGDGLGWGTEIFFVCLNDKCPIFNRSWDEFEERYGHSASCRYMLLPNEEKGGPMMVGSKDAFTGSTIDEKDLEKSSERYQKEKDALAKLDNCVDNNDLDPVICLITDEDANLEGRNRACELLLQLNNLECIDPIRNHDFRHTEIGQQADIVIGKILKNHNRRECKFCAEIIKRQAKVCKECGKEVEEC